MAMTETVVTDDTLICDLPLSVRSFNALHYNDIKTVGDLRKRSAKELMRIGNFGKKSLEEISPYMHCGVDNLQDASVAELKIEMALVVHQRDMLVRLCHIMGVSTDINVSMDQRGMQRNMSIVADVLSGGLTKTEIAKRYDVSHSRVRQICARHGKKIRKAVDEQKKFDDRVRLNDDTNPT